MEQDQPSLRYAWYMVALCMIAYIFSFIDRQIITLLVQPIREDLNISDTEFSLLHGLAFSIFYAIMGLPIARLADTKSRPLIISAGIFIWSLATAACGLTRTFWQLFLARMSVGVGEAALSPAAYSMIADSFPKDKLGRALSVYSTGSVIGAGLAFLIGGAAIEWIEGFGEVSLPLVGVLKPWQMTFFIVGVPGILIAALFLITVKDPARKGVVGEGQPYRIAEVAAYIKSQKFSFLAHYFGYGCLAMCMFALLSWAPEYVRRNFGLSPKEIGTYLGLLVIVSNTAGVLSSGWLVDFFTRRGHNNAPLRAGMVGGIGVIVPALLFSSITNFELSLILLGAAMYFSVFPMATSAAALQIMAPNQMRAQVTAGFFLFMNLFGITGGSFLVAACTDYYFGDDLSVGYSMSIVTALAGVVGTLILWWGLRHFSRTVEELNS